MVSGTLEAVPSTILKLFIISTLVRAEMMMQCAEFSMKLENEFR